LAPSRHDIEKKLIPFADAIRVRIGNENGMSLDEFNNELHFWILEPVSGLIMTSDEQKQWMDEIDALREELVKAQKDKLRIQRKSQMDLTVLLDKMKGFKPDEATIHESEIENLEEQIEELHEIVNTLQDEAKENKLEIKRITEENFQLRKGRDKSRQSEDDEDDENDENDDDNVPNLIDESQTKSIAEFKALQTENEFSEERMEFYQNDSNITKSQAYIAWKTKALESKSKIVDLERERKQSTEVYNEQIGKLKQTVQELQASKVNATIEHESHIEAYQNEIEKFKKKHFESEKVRKSSISALHDNLFSKLLEAEAEHEEVTANYKQQIGKLQKANKAFEGSMNEMAINKVDTIQNAAKTIQELRESVAALSKQCQILTQRNKALNSRSAWNSISSWMG